MVETSMFSTVASLRSAATKALLVVVVFFFDFLSILGGPSLGILRYNILPTLNLNQQ